MAQGDFLKRIDAELRTNKILEEDRAARQREMTAHGDALQDIRVELRQMSLRGERLAQGYLRALEDMSRVLEDMSDQLRANTRAVLSMLDRFERGDGPAAAGA
jgi:hypothetical protein